MTFNGIKLELISLICFDRMKLDNNMNPSLQESVVYVTSLCHNTNSLAGIL